MNRKTWLWVGVAVVAVLGFLYLSRGSGSSGTSATGSTAPSGPSDSLQETLGSFARDLGLAQIQADYENKQTAASLAGLQLQAQTAQRASDNAASVAKQGQVLDLIGQGITVGGSVVNTILSGRGRGGSVPTYSGGGSPYGGGNAFPGVGGFYGGGGGFGSFA